MTKCEHAPRQAETEVVLLDDTGGPSAAPPETQILSIENVARMFRVSRLTLRYYEFRGLIARRNVSGRTRLYNWADCERLSFIVKCRRAGLRLRDIIAVIEATDEDAPVYASEHGQELCMTLVDRLEARRKLLGEALAELAHIHALLSSKVAGRSQHSGDDAS